MTTMSNAATAAQTNSPAGALEPEFVDGLRTGFNADPAARFAQNAATCTDVNEIVLNRSVVASTDFTFSTLLDEWDVTNQKRSGRCWLFAALNLMRVGAMKTMNLKNFEFSQTYLFFWDKFERSNFFLEQIIDTIACERDDRTVSFLLDQPIDDGGQWNMVVNLIRKHGLVPQSVMPESQSSSNSGRMNSHLKSALREGASVLRSAHANGANAETLQATKHEVLKKIWRILAVHLGTPPESFDWQWNDADRKFHREGEMTPQAFAQKFTTLPLDDYVCIVHDPRESSPFGRTFTVDRLGNVVGGAPVVYLNVEMSVMKSITQSVLESGEPVWFGCDVGPYMQRDLGLWDSGLFEYEALYGSEFALDKAARLEYHDSAMTHAMLFTGVDVVDGAPRRWRVENSWGGDKSGRKGFFTMNDSWFDQYMFEIAARRGMLPEALQSALAEEPIVLPAWDPMGSLAR